MLRLFISAIVKPLIILIESGLIGLLFGILPCYVFPLFGGNGRDWCGYKSGPPHFLLQFCIGFGLTALVTIYFAYFEFTDFRQLAVELVFKPFVVAAACSAAWIVSVNILQEGRSESETWREALIVTLATLVAVVYAIYCRKG